MKKSTKGQELYSKDSNIIGIAKHLLQRWERELPFEKLDKQLQHYIPTTVGKAEKVSTEERKKGFDEIRDFTKSEDLLLLLLGDSGTGKSIFAQWLVNHLWKIWKKKNYWIPLYIHLPSVHIEENFLANYLKLQCGLSDTDIESLRCIGNLFIVFDAYDEMNLEFIGLNLHKLARLYRWRAKVIVTCRTEQLVRIPLSKQISMFCPYLDETIPFDLELRKLYVQNFDPNTDIPNYVETWKKHNTKLVDPSIDYLKEMNTLPGLADMITNPFILWITMSALPKIRRQFAQKPLLERYNLTRLSLMETFVQEWFLRQKNKPKNANITLQDFQTYCEELANLMWQNNVRTVHYQPSKQPTEWDIFFAEDGIFNNHPNKSLQSLRRGAPLRITNGNNYSFLHDSLLTYFANKQCFNSIIDTASMTLGLPFNSRYMFYNKEELSNAIDMVKNEPAFIKVLENILNESKYDPRVEIAAANAISILVAANISFARKDLRRIRVRYAKLTGGNFDGADLREADLRDTDLSGACISHANFSNCCLDGIKTSEVFEEDTGQTIVDCCFSPDGEHYFVQTYSKIIFYETLSHRRIATFSLGSSARYVPKFTPDSQNIFIGGDDGKYRIFNISKNRVTATWKGYNGLLAFREDNKSLLMECDTNPGKIHQLDIATGGHISTLECEDDIRFMATYPQYKMAISCSNVGTMRKWDLETGECLLTYQPNTDPKIRTRNSNRFTVNDKIMSMKHKENSLYITTASTSGEIIKWHALNLTVELIYQTNCTVDYFVLSYDQNFALFAHKDGTIISWDHKAGTCLAKWLTTINFVARDINGSVWIDKSKLLLTKNNLLLSYSDDGYIYSWNIRTGELVAKWQAQQDLNALVLNTDHTWILSVSTHEIRKWELSTRQCLATWEINATDSGPVAVSPDDSWMLVANNSPSQGSSMAYLASYEVLRIETTVAPPRKNHVIGLDRTSLTLSNDARWILLNKVLYDTSTGGLICITDTSKEQLKKLGFNTPNWVFSKNRRNKRNQHQDMQNDVLVLDANTAEVIKSVSSADGQWIAAATTNNSIKVWHRHIRRHKLRFPTETKPPEKLQICCENDGTYSLFCVSGDKTITKWDLQTGKCLFTLMASLKSQHNHTISANGQWGIVGGDDSSRFSPYKWAIQTLDLQRGRHLSTLPTWTHHFSMFSSLVISPDGNWIIAACDSPKLTLWSTRSNQLCQTINFYSAPHKIIWATSNPSLIVIHVMSDEIKVFTFSEDPPALHLQWSNAKQKLEANNCQLLGCYGLTFFHQHIFSSLKAKVQVSSKTSEAIIRRRKESIPYDPARPPRCLFDPTITIKPDKWTVTIAHPKEGQGKLHAFLILESVEGEQYCIRRIELVLEQRHQFLAENPNTGVSGNIFGQALIEITKYTLFDAQSLAKYCFGIPVEITAEEGNQLMANVRKDQSERISYCKMGGGSIYRIFRIKDTREHHNCYSWCIKQLEKIRKNILGRGWLSPIVEYPDLKNEGSDNSETDHDGSQSNTHCVMM